MTKELVYTLLGSLLLTLAVVVAFKACAKIPASETSYVLLLQKLDQMQKQGHNFDLRLTLENKGSAMLFFSQDAYNVTDGLRVFKKPNECLGNACVCNCYETNTQFGPQQIVTCVKPKCDPQPYRFIDARYYDKDAPYRNAGYVLHNLAGGLKTQAVYLERFQQGIVVLCPRAPCITEELKHFLTFDRILSGSFNDCLGDPTTCDAVLQTLLRVVDSKDYSLELRPVKDAESKDQTNLTLLKGDERRWNLQQSFFCLKDKTAVAEKPFTDKLLIQFDIESQPLLLGQDKLVGILSENSKICLLYESP